MRKTIGVPVLAFLLAAAAVPAVASAGRSASRTERHHEGEESLFSSLQPRSEPVYGIATPEDGGDIRILEGIEGDVYVETYLPVEKEGRTPPARYPTILIMTPYASLERIVNPVAEGNGHRRLIDFFVPRGYAVAVGHVPGTGKSDGCFEWSGRVEVDASELAIEYLGRDARWANGNVGMIGGSADARSQVAVAALGDPRKTDYLKAIVPIEANTGAYEQAFAGDGVPITYTTVANPTMGTASITAFRDPADPLQGQRSYGCNPDTAKASLGHELSGNFNDWDAERDYRPGAGRIDAATLMVHGQRDWNAMPWAPLGFFDRIPKKTPAMLLMGQWGHEFPDRTGSHPLPGFMSLVHAWMDRFLMDADTGVDALPRVATQDNFGGWHAESSWPDTGGPAGQLALSEAGTLGSMEPRGTSAYLEASVGLAPAEAGGARGAVTFSTPPIEKAVHLTGLPVLDLWVRSDTTDAHVAASLDVIGPDGARIDHPFVMGVRSIRHRQAMPDDYFEQRLETGYEPNSLVRLPVRLSPVDLVVPAGHMLRLTVSSSYRLSLQSPLPETPNSEPSGTNARVTIVHDCAHPSVLRFDLSEASPEEGNLSTSPKGNGGVADTSGTLDLVTNRVCGQRPIHPLDVTRSV